MAGYPDYTPPSSGGGGGAVDSVNGQTGVVVLDAADVGALTETAADALYATAAQGALADSAVQPGDLPAVSPVVNILARQTLI
jgi:hypothetical protein